MREAQQERNRWKLSPCWCHSKKLAGACCLSGDRWHKPPTKVKLRLRSTTPSLDRCYMRELGSCEPPISGEHLISEGVLNVLRAGGDFTVSGLPWLEAGETKKLASGNLTAKCLCKGHNSALSPLDEFAVLFFSVLKQCLTDVGTSNADLDRFERRSPDIALLVAGHDLERWLLKTFKAMASSGNLASGRMKLPDLFQRDVDVIAMLEEPAKWPPGTGLYFVMPPGSRFVNNDRIRIQPWYGDNQNELIGLWTSFLGFEFVLMIAAPDLSRSPALGQWLHRPGRIKVKFGQSKRIIELSWTDRLRHPAITANFDRSVSRP